MYLPCIEYMYTLSNSTIYSSVLINYLWFNIVTGDIYLYSLPISVL